MKLAPLLGGWVLFLVLVQYAVPGRNLYHDGWYNVLLAALAIWAIVASARDRMWLFAFGVAAVAFAGVANGLLAPDDQTVIGAPGASVGTQAGVALTFPPLDRGGEIPALRVTMGALLRRIDRTVVEVEARDARGGHLTVTQPTGSAFLSPVLLMQQQQTISGLLLPYDSFALPGEHRLVKAVLFSRDQAQTLPALAAFGGPVVLFDLEDETGVSIPHGIGVAPDGRTAVIDGVQLEPHVRSYPAIEVMAIPDIAVVVLGILAGCAGSLLTLRPKPATMPQR